MNDTVKKQYDEYKKLIEEHLNKYIEVKYPKSIYEAMRYSLLSGGKRLRGVIAIETALIYGAKIEEIMPVACAIEMLHCQSLIHDDLPCMDDDDYRRGKPSNHKVFGEAVAVLAGDAFLSFAPNLIIEKTPNTIKSETLLRVLQEFFASAGVDGIISGQVVDIESEKNKIDKKTLEFIQEYKTAKMFELSFRASAIIANANKKTLQNLTMLGRYFGRAFQIYDDILDVTSTFEEIGKTPGKDEKEEKQTYVSMFGLKKAKEHITFLLNKCYDIIEKEKIESEILSAIISDIIEGVDKRVSED